MVMFSSLSCSYHLSPRELDIKSETVLSLQNIKPVAIKARLVGTKERLLPLAGTDVTVNEDEFSDVLVERLTETLQNSNISVIPMSERLIEIQVVRVSLQPDITFIGFRRVAVRRGGVGGVPVF